MDASFWWHAGWSATVGVEDMLKWDQSFYTEDLLKKASTHKRTIILKKRKQTYQLFWQKGRGTRGISNRTGDAIKNLCKQRFSPG